MFKYFETLSRTERETKAEELKALYNAAVKDEQETFVEYR